MYIVTRFPFNRPTVSTLWITERVKKDLLKQLGKGDPQHFLVRLESLFGRDVGAYLQIGDGPLSYEWGGVYRIGFKSSLIRLFGFFEEGTDNGSFIVLEMCVKPGQKLGARCTDAINRVARAAESGDWKKEE